MRYKVSSSVFWIGSVVTRLLLAYLYISVTFVKLRSKEG